MTHDLKIWPSFFAAVENGSKTFEVRKNDRNFTVGDTLLLREWDPGSQTYTGREITKTVSYRMLGSDRIGADFVLRADYCVLGLK